MSYNEHLAVEDVKIMQSLVLHHNFSSEDLLKHSFSLDNVTSSLAHTFKTSECLNSLQPLVGCISSYIMKKKSTIAKLAISLNRFCFPSSYFNLNVKTVKQCSFFL